MNRDAAALADAVRAEADSRGLDYKRIEAILKDRWDNPRAAGKSTGVPRDPGGPGHRKAVLRAIGGILGDKTGSIPQDDLREAFFLLRRDFDFLVPHDILPTRLEKLGKTVKNIFAAVFFVFCAYIIIGGIIEGESAISLGTHPTVTLLVLLAVMTFLAIVEGLEIAATAIILKNLDRVAGRFPAHAIHSLLVQGNNLSRFLAGRQVFVILLVFIAAQITTFPRMDHWPFSDTRFDPILLPWFRVIFLELGLLGAFFVVWFGQLAPKLLASKRPMEFLQLPPMKPIVKLTLIVEALGLTTVSSWISDRFRQGEKNIPIAPVERYRANVDLLGVATRGRYVDILFENDTVMIKDSRTLAIRTDIRRLFDRFQMKMWGIRTFSYRIAASTGKAGDHVTLTGTEDYPRLDDRKRAMRVFPAVFELKKRGFRQGDSLHITRHFTGYGTSPGRFRNFRVELSTPPQLLDISLRFRGCGIEDAYISVFPLEEIMDESRSGKKSLPVKDGANGEQTVRYTGWYPGVGTIHEIGWTVFRDMNGEKGEPDRESNRDGT